MRNGQQYRDSLRDGRTVYVYGERVPDVTTHPAFAGIVDTVAGLYDYAGDPANGMIHTNPDSGTPGNKAFLIPRSPDDLRARREAIRTWARRTNGLVGRGP